MFFSTLAETPKLERATLDGGDRQVLLHVLSQQMVRPQGLSLDLANQHLYWTDSYLDRIERINYNGTNRVLILRRVWVSFSLQSHVFMFAIESRTFVEEVI